MKKWISIALFLVMSLMLSSCATKEEKIIKNCPFEISENAVIENYPSDNLFGLTTIIYDENQDSNVAIIVFKKSNRNLFNLKEDDSIDALICDESGYKESFIWNEEIIKKYNKGYFYCNISYEKNSKLENITFARPNSDESCAICFKSEIVNKNNLYLRYTKVLKYGDPTEYRKKSQSYDESSSKWGEIEAREYEEYSKREYE